MKPYFETENGKLYHGDCLEILPELEPVDLVLTDPPYGIGINKSNRLSISRGFIGERWDNTPIDKKIIDLIFSLSKDQVIWGGNYYNMPPTRCFLVWDKKNDGRDFADCEYAWTSFDLVARIFRMRPMNMDGGKVHPTQKPLSLFVWILNAFTPNAKTILDPFFGSGTTGVACEELVRKWIGIEISEKYCEIAARRIEKETQQLRLFV